MANLTKKAEIDIKKMGNQYTFTIFATLWKRTDLY